MDFSHFKQDSRHEVITTPGTIKVTNGTDWMFLLREDVKYITDKYYLLLQKNTSETNNAKLHGIITAHYLAFLNDLFDIFDWAFKEKGHYKINLFLSTFLEEETVRRCSNRAAVSMDPLLSEGFTRLNVSRGFRTGGKEFIRMVESPGTPPLMDQVKNISNRYHDRGIVLVDDDIFTGTSLVDVIKMLKDGGLCISEVIPGIQIGEPSALLEMGVKLNPIVRYTSNNPVLLKNVNLCDPGDFLFGGRGLVVLIGENQYGRAPYSLPFINVAKKVGINQSKEEELTQKVIQANRRFYSGLQDSLSCIFKIKYFERSFADFIRITSGLNEEESILEVVEWASANVGVGSTKKSVRV